MRQLFLLFILIAFVAIATVLPVRAAQNEVKPGSRVTFVSGGVGEDSAERMAALSKDFNLKLLFAAKDGHYLAEVAVVVSDARGAKVFEAVSEGPFLLASLAPGKYQIKATYARESFTRATTVPASGQRELIFRWAEQTD